MTSLLTRVGQVESRASTQTLWKSGKRKRGDWVCRECRVRRLLEHKRGYGDDSLRVPVNQYLFPSHLQQDDQAEHRAAGRREATLPGKPQISQAAWGFSVNERRSRARLVQSSGAAGLSFDQNPTSEALGTPDVVEHQEQAGDKLWEQFEQEEELTTPHYNNAFGSEVTMSAETERHESDEGAKDLAYPQRDSSLLDLDYAATLAEALLKREPNLAARCLLAASRRNDLQWIHSLSTSTFTAVLALLEPANSIGWLISQHLEMSEALARQVGVVPMDQVAHEYSQLMSEIVALRRGVGVALTLDDYKVLLRGARDLGNRQMAMAFWKKLWLDGHKADTDCYNYYMSSVISSGAHRAETRHKVRVIPFFELARKISNAGSQFAGYRLGPDGIKEQIMNMFRRMLRDGAIANEESFRAVIVAAAREGDLTTVKSILRKVWNVHVDAIVAGKNEDETLPKALPPESSLYPTSKLLLAIAHAFGINNDISTALRLVDFVAQHYHLTIAPDVWSQLFELTYLLATPRSGIKSRTDGTRAGRLPLQSVENLWNTMTNAPYLIKPTLGMYNQLITTLFHRDMAPAMIERMEEGRQMYVQAKNRSRLLWDQLRKTVEIMDRTALPENECLERLADEWQCADLIRKRDIFWLKRWLRFLLATSRGRSKLDDDQDFTMRILPRMMWTWRAFAPTNVRYHTPNGTVEFATRTPEEIDVSAVQGARHRALVQQVLKRVGKCVGAHWLHEREHGLPVRFRRGASDDAVVASLKDVHRED